MTAASTLACLALCAASGLALAAPPAATAPAPVQAASPAPLTGEVQEVLRVDSYVYLRLKTAQGEAWAAVPTTPVAKGAKVAIGNPMTMRQFESKSLKRTFDTIYFGTLVDPNAKPAALVPVPGGGGPAATIGSMPSFNAGAAPAAMPANPHAGMTPAAAPPKVGKVPKATGPDAKTVAEVVAGRAKLKDKPVTVRAQVVKLSKGILGKNWLHLQDGSGTEKDGSHDILVTSTELAAVGDVVTVRGTVHTDVDLGSGYRYDVMIGEATLKK